MLDNTYQARPEIRLADLRARLVKDGLDGFVIPICDERMSEYVGGLGRTR